LPGSAYARDGPHYEHTGLWVEFRFLPEHPVAATPEVTGEVERLVLALGGRMSRAQIQ
jgi:hypothetical protein